MKQYIFRMPVHYKPLLHCVPTAIPMLNYVIIWKYNFFYICFFQSFYKDFMGLIFYLKKNQLHVMNNILNENATFKTHFMVTSTVQPSCNERDIPVSERFIYIIFIC